MLSFTLEVDGPATTIWQARTAKGNLVGITKDVLTGKFAYSLTSRIGYCLTGEYVGSYDEAVTKATERAEFYAM